MEHVCTCVSGQLKFFLLPAAAMTSTAFLCYRSHTMVARQAANSGRINFTCVESSPLIESKTNVFLGVDFSSSVVGDVTSMHRATSASLPDPPPSGRMRTKTWMLWSFAADLHHS